MNILSLFCHSWRVQLVMAMIPSPPPPPGIISFFLEASPLQTWQLSVLLSQQLLAHLSLPGNAFGMLCEFRSIFKRAYVKRKIDRGNITQLFGGDWMCGGKRSPTVTIGCSQDGRLAWQPIPFVFLLSGMKWSPCWVVQKLWDWFSSVNQPRQNSKQLESN